jgi:hypothetical protein
MSAFQFGHFAAVDVHFANSGSAGYGHSPSCRFEACPWSLLRRLNEVHVQPPQAVEPPELGIGGAGDEAIRAMRARTIDVSAVVGA